jgi:ParB family chromosome partitioning protein
MANKHGLGRGLGALIKDGVTRSSQEDNSGDILKVPLDTIHRSQWQPRQDFEEEALAELTQSIRERGILQPLLVRRVGEGYELIAGERRLRAAGEAGLTEAPVIVMQAGDGEAMEMALIENLQREDLSILEEAEGYDVLRKQFELTQEQIADRVGKARASVTNALRLLTLPQEIKDLVRNGSLTAGHAKLLVGVEIADEQVHFARRTVKEGLSVHNLEKVLQRARRVPRKPRAVRVEIPEDHLAYLSDQLHAHLGTAIRISPCRTFANGKKGKGTIEIDFYSGDDLHRVLEVLGLSMDGDS